MTATQRHRQGSWRMVAAMRRSAGTLRYINDELVRAHEAISLRAGAPPPHPPAGTSASSPTAVDGSEEASATAHTDRAA